MTGMGSGGTGAEDTSGGTGLRLCVVLPLNPELPLSPTVLSHSQQGKSDGPALSSPASPQGPFSGVEQLEI